MFSKNRLGKIERSRIMIAAVSRHAGSFNERLHRIALCVRGVLMPDQFDCAYEFGPALKAMLAGDDKLCVRQTVFILVTLFGGKIFCESLQLLRLRQLADVEKVLGLFFV